MHASHTTLNVTKIQCKAFQETGFIATKEIKELATNKSKGIISSQLVEDLCMGMPMVQ